MKANKYKAEKYTIDGITFDSKDEGHYYEALKIMKSKGEIKNFELQPKFTLIPSFKKNGKTYRAITYTPDFLIYTNDDKEIYVDIKGMTTQQGELRIKLFNYFNRDKELRIISRSIKYGDKYGFIDYYQLQRIRKANRKKDKSK